MRRNPFSGFIWLFILLFFFGTGGFIPVIVMAAVLFAILSVISSISKSSTTNTRSYSNNPYSRTYTANNANQTRSTLTPAELATINVFLRKYFQSHASLSVLADVQLRIHGRSYNSLSSLDAYRNGNYVCGLNEFGRRYPDMYSEILRVLASQANNAQANKSDVYDAEVVTPAEKASTAQTTTPTPEPKKEVCAQDFLNQINELNEDIPDKEISDGLFETCALLKQISTMEKKFPASRPKLDKLYVHYLPILIKVLTQYDNLQIAKTDPNYDKTRDQLQRTLLMINNAMKKLISSLTDSDFINLSADLSTLEAVLQKDGLAEDNPLSSQSSPTNGLQMPSGGDNKQEGQ